MKFIRTQTLNGVKTTKEYPDTPFFKTAYEHRFSSRKTLKFYIKEIEKDMNEYKEYLKDPENTPEEIKEYTKEIDIRKERIKHLELLLFSSWFSGWSAGLE